MSKEEAAKKLRNDVLIGLAGLAAAIVTLALTGGKGILGLLLPFAEAMVVVFSLTQGIYHWRVTKGLVESNPDTLVPLPPLPQQEEEKPDEKDVRQQEAIPKQAVFCPFCGEKLIKSGDFCPHCGKKREEL